MILYQLKCSTDHQFEAWFRDGAAYDLQCADGQINCPFCGDNHISKAPMAPYLGKRRSNAGDSETRAEEFAERMLEAVGQIQTHVEENCEDVGERFADEAKRIHYGEAEERGIYGQATDDEASELDEEDIEYFRLPFLPRRRDG